jgi:hypothetical protein
MAIKVVHTKVSTIPDGDDSSLIRPSDWNADHALTGLGTMAEQDANAVAITGGTITGVTIPADDVTGTLTVPHGGTGATTLTGYVKGNGTSAMTASTTIPNTDITGLGTAAVLNAGVANGVATLDSGGQIPLSQIPPLGDLNYQGSWNASTNTPTLTSSVGTKGYYYVVSVAGTTNLNGITDWQIGDWAVFNGSVWQKIDNTDAVTSVNGYTGTVVLTQPDIAGTVPTSRTISTGTGLTGGGDLSANRTISFSNSAVATWANTPSSANLAAAVTDETGSGSLVFGTNPTLANPNIDVVDFDTTYATTLTAGQLGWDGNNTLALGMAGGNVIQHIGEDTFYYVKASSAITKGQVVMFTGAVGASGVPTAAPATGVTNPQVIMGIAAESIALNGFGLIQNFGEVKNVNTTGFSDGDIVYYDSSVTGGFTKTYPTSGSIVTVAAIINGGSSGGGVVFVRVSVTQRLTASTGISVSQNGTGTTITNTAPDQTVAISSGTGISVTGTYPNFTVTNTSPSSGGTVTSVSGTAPVSVATGTTTPVISMAAANGTTNGYLTSTDWTTFNSKQPAGTYVTSVSGTTGRITSSGGTTPAIDLASGVATPGTTGSASLIPVITIDTYGRVTSITTAANPQGTVTSVAASVPSFLSISGSPITSSGTLAISYSGTALPIANGGTNQTAFTGPSGNVKGLVYFDGTSLANDATVTDAGYDTSTNTLQAKNMTASGTITAANYVGISGGTF